MSHATNASSQNCHDIDLVSQPKHEIKSKWEMEDTLLLMIWIWGWRTVCGKGVEARVKYRGEESGWGGGFTSATTLLQYACNSFPLVSISPFGDHSSFPGLRHHQVPSPSSSSRFYLQKWPRVGSVIVPSQTWKLKHRMMRQIVQGYAAGV